jgi:very-short-patch-repair endonuclease
MKKNKTHDPPQSKDNRRTLRKNLTTAEAFLWNHLKTKKLDGRKFRRQHGIKQYIIDFYCAEESLIIELDGEVHNNPKAKEYDTKRTAVLNALGLKVIRFENKMVFENLPSVLMEIRDNFKN